MTKYYDHRQLKEERVYLDLDSRGVRAAHHSGKASRQMAGMEAGAGSPEITASKASRKQRGQARHV